MSLKSIKRREVGTCLPQPKTILQPLTCTLATGQQLALTVLEQTKMIRWSKANPSVDFKLTCSLTIRNGRAMQPPLASISSILRSNSWQRGQELSIHQRRKKLDWEQIASKTSEDSNWITLSSLRGWGLLELAFEISRLYTITISRLRIGVIMASSTKVARIWLRVSNPMKMAHFLDLANRTHTTGRWLVRSPSKVSASQQNLSKLERSERTSSSLLTRDGLNFQWAQTECTNWRISISSMALGALQVNN